MEGATEVFEVGTTLDSRLARNALRKDSEPLRTVCARQVVTSRGILGRGATGSNFEASVASEVVNLARRQALQRLGIVERIE